MWRASMLFFLLFAFLAFMPKGKNCCSKRNYFFQLEVIILGKLKEIITINIGYRVLTGRRRKEAGTHIFSSSNLKAKHDQLLPILWHSHLYFHSCWESEHK